jgi:predicted LPLAT superfamily acyltransferase
VQQTETDNDANSQRQWSSRSLGTRFGHSIFYALIHLGGKRLGYFALHWVVSYYVLCRPSIRRRSDDYLRRRFPGQSLFMRYVNCYRMFLEMGRILVDRAILGSMGPEKMNFTIHGRQELLDLVQEGRGFILLMSHVGCWQVAVSALNFLNVTVNLLLEQEQGNIDRHYFEYAGVTCPIRIIDPGSYLGGTMQMLDVLKKGEVVSMMGDRVFGSEKSSLLIDFLGHKAPFPFSAFKIASATGAPIVVFFSYKTGYDNYVLNVSKIIKVPGNLGRSGESYRRYLTQFVNELERYTREYPYQFFNFYNMWQSNDLTVPKK